MDCKEFYSTAKAQARVYNPFGVTVQAVKETGWFKSKLCREAHNYGGVKARGNVPVYVIASDEEVNGVTKSVVSSFRKYDSAEDYLDKLNEKLSEERYRVCRLGKDCFWIHFAGLYLGGWATDTHYFRGLCQLVPILAPKLLDSEWREHIRASYRKAKASGHIQLWMGRAIEEVI